MLLQTFQLIRRIFFILMFFRLFVVLSFELNEGIENLGHAKRKKTIKKCFHYGFIATFIHYNGSLSKAMACWPWSMPALAWCIWLVLTFPWSFHDPSMITAGLNWYLPRSWQAYFGISEGKVMQNYWIVFHSVFQVQINFNEQFIQIEWVIILIFLTRTHTLQPLYFE